MYKPSKFLVGSYDPKEKKAYNLYVIEATRSDDAIYEYYDIYNLWDEDLSGNLVKVIKVLPEDATIGPFQEGLVIYDKNECHLCRDNIIEIGDVITLGRHKIPCFAKYCPSCGKRLQAIVSHELYMRSYGRDTVMDKMHFDLYDWEDIYYTTLPVRMYDMMKMDKIVENQKKIPNKYLLGSYNKSQKDMKKDYYVLHNLHIIEADYADDAIYEYRNMYDIQEFRNRGYNILVQIIKVLPEDAETGHGASGRVVYMNKKDTSCHLCRDHIIEDGDRILVGKGVKIPSRAKYCPCCGEDLKKLMANHKVSMCYGDIGLDIRNEYEQYSQWEEMKNRMFEKARNKKNVK